jgi:hypothetical protein
LRARDVVRTNNSPVGDIAEAIVAAHYGCTRGSFEQAGWDICTPGGEHLQVKGMRRTSTTKRRNLSEGAVGGPSPTGSIRRTVRAAFPA